VYTPERFARLSRPFQRLDLALPQACSIAPKRPPCFTDFGHSPGDLDLIQLTVDRSKVLTAGTSKIVTESAFVTLAHGLIPGNADGLEIQFSTKPITEAARTDILENGARES
jgi:hypothetical protein